MLKIEDRNVPDGGRVSISLLGKKDSLSPGLDRVWVSW